MSEATEHTRNNQFSVFSIDFSLWNFQFSSFFQKCLLFQLLVISQKLIPFPLIVLIRLQCRLDEFLQGSLISEYFHFLFNFVRSPFKEKLKFAKIWILNYAIMINSDEIKYVYSSCVKFTHRTLSSLKEKYAWPISAQRSNSENGVPRGVIHYQLIDVDWIWMFFWDWFITLWSSNCLFWNLKSVLGVRKCQKWC